MTIPFLDVRITALDPGVAKESARQAIAAMQANGETSLKFRPTLWAELTTQEQQQAKLAIEAQGWTCLNVVGQGL